jgi:hypothetical protein
MLFCQVLTDGGNSSKRGPFMVVWDLAEWWLDHAIPIAWPNEVSKRDFPKPFPLSPPSPCLNGTADFLAGGPGTCYPAERSEQEASTHVLIVWDPPRILHHRLSVSMVRVYCALSGEVKRLAASPPRLREPGPCPSGRFCQRCPSMAPCPMSGLFAPSCDNFCHFCTIM